MATKKHYSQNEREEKTGIKGLRPPKVDYRIYGQIKPNEPKGLYIDKGPLAAILFFILYLGFVIGIILSSWVLK
jgi:hypothetical protein